MSKNKSAKKAICDFLLEIITIQKRSLTKVEISDLLEKHDLLNRFKTYLFSIKLAKRDSNGNFVLVKSEIDVDKIDDIVDRLHAGFEEKHNISPWYVITEKAKRTPEKFPKGKSDEIDGLHIRRLTGRELIESCSENGIIKRDVGMLLTFGIEDRGYINRSSTTEITTMSVKKYGL